MNMTTIMNNPWESLDTLSKLRIDAGDYSAFWIMDSLNRYGLMIQCDKDFIKPKKEIKLKGIKLQLDFTTKPNKLILILREKDDWEIFLILCNDLINVLKNQAGNPINNIFKRMYRWQKLLRQTNLKMMSKEEQMGLFSELKILLNYIIPKYGRVNGISSWVGALGDKQDFLLDSFSIEVKSFRLSAGNKVWISSKEQLNSDNKPIYLITCALIEFTSGESVVDMVEIIGRELKDDYLISEFNDRLERYGYFPELPKNYFTNFVLEKTIGYEVREEFPKINIEHVSANIKDLKYSIDLSDCSKFKVDLNVVLNNGVVSYDNY